MINLYKITFKKSLADKLLFTVFFRSKQNKSLLLQHKIVAVHGLKSRGLTTLGHCERPPNQGKPLAKLLRNVSGAQLSVS